MRVGIIGINHKFADLSLRETLAKAFQKCFEKLKSVQGGYVLLSTCNRVELYFSANNLAETHSIILSLLKQEADLEHCQKLYSYFGSDCFLHLTKVTAGFDSAIVAETEIKRQVQQAYEQASKMKRLPPYMHLLFQKSLQISKSIRSKYTLGLGMLNIEHAIFRTGIHYFKTPEEKSILLIGSSAINQKVLDHLQKKGCTSITLCNRSYENGEKLALKYQIPLIPFSQIDQWARFDWIILGTKAPNYLIHYQKNIENKKLIIDLSLPRNADPKLALEPKIQLLNIDQLKFRQKMIDPTLMQAEQEIHRLVSKHALLISTKLNSCFNDLNCAQHSLSAI